MSWITKFVERVGTDKLLHALVCLPIAWGFTEWFYLHFVEHNGFGACFVCWFLGVLVSSCVGYTKEWFDNLQEGNKFDRKDFLADIAGGVIGSTISILLAL